MMTSKMPKSASHKFEIRVETIVNKKNSPSGGYTVYDLADDILGENVRPVREPQRRTTLSSRYGM